MPHELDTVASPSACRPSLPSRFVCSWTDIGGEAAWVHLAGELDLASALALERTLRRPRAGTPLVFIDLRGLEFIDTAGVRALVHASISARRDGNRLLLVRGRPNVDRMFALARSSDDVDIIDLAEQAPAIQALARLAAQEPAFVG